MRISELSRRSGVPVATIKYYLREGLLHPGEATAATQARYDDGHLHRLRLVRALVDVGQLSLTATKRILDAVDDDSVGLHHLLGIAHHALGPRADPPDDDPEWATVHAEVDALLAELGWHVSAHAPGREVLTRALVTLRRLGQRAAATELRPYAEAVRGLATLELSGFVEQAPRTDLVERAVLGTILYEPVLLALRRLAQEHESAQRFAH